MSTPIPLVFGAPSRQLAGLLHLPEASVARDVGVVLCNPLGHEAMSAHRTLRHLAERLATAGIATLRFDYHGTGDSSGDLDGAASVLAFRADVHAAVAELRAVTRLDRVALFGLRFGATLAALAGRDAGVQALALWAPCSSGRAYVRELRALGMLRDASHRAAPSAPHREEIAGFAFPSTLLDEIAGIDLAAVELPLAPRVLLVPRDDLPNGEARLAIRLRSHGGDVTVAASPGYAAALRDPQDTVVPGPLLDTVVAWMLDGTSLRAPLGIANDAPPVLLAATGARKPVRERAVRFGAGNRLFGVLAEPATDDRSLGATILFLNVGANHHVGPGRLYVTLARELAGAGHASLRFDLAGLGESATARGNAENALYASGASDDVTTALTFLESTLGPIRPVLMGICSGAYAAFHTTANDSRVAAQILVNPQTFSWNEGDSLRLLPRENRKSTRYYLHALGERDVWRQALRGQLDVRSVADVLRHRTLARAHAELGDAVARLRGLPARVSDVERTLCTLSDRGVKSLLVLGADDGGLDMVERHLGPFGSRVRKHAGIRLTVIDGADHTFTALRFRNELGAVVRSFLDRFLAAESQTTTAARR